MASACTHLPDNITVALHLQNDSAPPGVHIILHIQLTTPLLDEQNHPVISLTSPSCSPEQCLAEESTQLSTSQRCMEPLDHSARAQEVLILKRREKTW